MACDKPILYLGFALPACVEEEVAQVDSLPHLATQKFSWSVVRALKSAFRSVSVVSAPEIRNFPVVRKVFFNTAHFDENRTACLVVGFINVIVLKHISRFLQVVLRAPRYMKNNNIKIILVHGTHTPFMFFALLAKVIFSIRIVILLTDQHGIEVSSDGFLGRVFRRIDTSLMKFILSRFDAYVCLSPVFISKFNLSPSVVVPGILSAEYSSLAPVVTPSDAFEIVFAGGVHKSNGIDLLLLAFSELDNPNVRLTVYGGGDLVKSVIDAAEKDKRLFYGGILHGDKLVQALLSADLLINPRPTNEEFSQTSFPSKLIEYMATGVPTLTTRLVSIPKVIDDCFFYIDSHDPLTIAEAIRGVIALTDTERLSVGRRAAEKVRQLYSEEVVGQKISDLVRSIS